MGWQAVLREDLARAAREAISDIARELETSPVEHKTPVDTTLFWAYAAGLFDDEASAQALEAATAATVELLETQQLGRLSLFSGMCGAGFVLSHVVEDTADDLAALDEVVEAQLASVDDGPWQQDYDLIAGLTGYAVFMLERLAAGSTRARGLLQRVVELLQRTAVSVDGHHTWHTPTRVLPPWQAARAPDGYYNLGVAHGIPGTISVLARIATTPDLGATADTARSLALDALAGLEQRMLPPDPHGRFAAWVLPGHPAERARSAWCYGEPGVAVAAWSAARRLGASTDVWQQLARDSAQRPFALSGIEDAGLCHGAMGLAHLFNRCFQASGEAGFADAVNAWTERALAMRVPGSGIAGFTALQMIAPGAPQRRVSTQDVLEGASGVGLGLMALIASDEPSWDRILAIDLPPA